MYCSIAEFIEAFGEEEAIELTNLYSPQTPVLDEAQLTRALTDASVFIDSYLQGRVTLPLEGLAIPATLRACCADIARYRLDRLRCREEVRIRYEDWITWLKDVARGVVNLGLDRQNPPQSVTTAPDQVYVRSSERVFTDQALRGY